MMFIDDVYLKILKKIPLKVYRKCMGTYQVFFYPFATAVTTRMPKTVHE